jgi:hypothetical protein
MPGVAASKRTRSSSDIKNSMTEPTRAVFRNNSSFFPSSLLINISKIAHNSGKKMRVLRIGKLS